MARIVGHLPVAELEARYRAARDATEARHFQAIWLLAQGRTVLEVAEVLAFVPRWVTQPAARPDACGPEALGDRRRRGGSAGRPRRRGRGMRAPRRPSSGPPSRGARGGGGAGQGGASRPAGRGLGGGRAPPRPEAGPAPAGLGVGGHAAGRARRPPLPVAARGRLRAAQRRGGLVSLQPPLEAFLRSAARRLRAA